MLAKDFLTEIATLTDGQLDLPRAVHHYKYPLYGGIAGPGKTHTEVATAAYLSFLNGCAGVDTAGAFISGDRKRIIERYMPAIKTQLVNKGIGNVFGASEKEPPGFRFFNKSIPPIYFVGLFDLDALKGRQLAFAAWDEVTESEEEAFHALNWRVRFSHPNKPLKHDPIFGATNPDGVGAYWVSEYWISKTFNTPLGDNIKSEADQFYFIGAQIQDNPDVAFRESYVQVLKTLPTHLRDARLYGLWNTGVGARFPFPLNVIRWSDLPGSCIPDHWERFIGIDWGYGHDPCKIFWLAFDERKNAYVYRSASYFGLGIEKVASKFREINGGEPYRVFSCDPTMFARDPKELRGLNTYFEDVGITLTKSTNSHEITNALVENYLDPNNDWPNIYFIEGATDTLTSDIRAVRFDSEAKQPENLVPHAHTHTVYALGYALHGAYPSTTEPDRRTDSERDYADRVDRLMRKAYSGHRGMLIGN